MACSSKPANWQRTLRPSIGSWERGAISPGDNHPKAAAFFTVCTEVAGFNQAVVEHRYHDGRSALNAFGAGSGSCRLLPRGSTQLVESMSCWIHHHARLPNTYLTAYYSGCRYWSPPDLASCLAFLLISSPGDIFGNLSSNSSAQAFRIHLVAKIPFARAAVPHRAAWPQRPRGWAYRRRDAYIAL